MGRKKEEKKTLTGKTDERSLTGKTFIKLQKTMEF